MADLEDQRPASLAPVNGLSDNGTDYDDANLGPDTSHFSKFDDPHSPTYDPFSSQPSSRMAHKELDSPVHEYGQYESEGDFHRAGQQEGEGDYHRAGHHESEGDFHQHEGHHEDYGHYEDDQDDEDLPANFAKEAARHHNVSESEQYEDEQRDDPEYEGEEDAQHGSDFDSHAGESVNKGNGGGYVDNSDRPIMGYNPFLNEEARDEKEQVGVAQEEGVHSLEGDFGDAEREVSSSYAGLRQDDDDEEQDNQDRQVGRQHGYDEEVYDREDNDGRFDDDAAAADDDDAAGSIPHERAHSQEEKEVDEGESNSRPEHKSGDFDSRQFDDGYDTRGGLGEQGHFDGYQYPGSQQPEIDFESAGVYEDEAREDVENVPPQTSQVQEDDLGIVNQGFSDDADLDGEKVIPEEDIVETEEPVVHAPHIGDVELYEDEGEGRKRGQEKEDRDGGYDNERVGVEEKAYGSEDEQEAEESIPRGEDKLRYGEEESGYEAAEKEDYTKEADRIQSGEEDYVHERENYDEEETDPVSGTKEDSACDQDRFEEEETEHSESTEDYAHEPLRMSEEMERSTIVEGGHFQDEIRYDDADSADEKEFSSHLAKSDLLSSDRSFVDNLSDVTSPETIPQPLPSPPEPKNMSSLEPQADLDSASPLYGGPHENVGQHTALFQQAVGLDESNTVDFLTAGEVEGETKFDVDGTAITSTSQNNAFLHSDEEDEEDEEDEDESQHLDQGLVTTGTTETETSVDEKTGEYGAQPMTANDNALMSMSMEGSFYDDGGELIGGDDRRNQDDHVLYDDGVSLGEDIHQTEKVQPKQENFLDDEGDDYGHEVEEQETDQIIDEFDVRGDESLKDDSLHIAPGVNGGSYEEDLKPEGLDLLIDVLTPEPASQPQVTEQYKHADSSLDIAGVDFTATEPESSVDFTPIEPESSVDFAPIEPESSVDSPQLHAHEPPSPKDMDEIHVSDIAASKPEEPASSVDESPAADKEATSCAALGAAAAATAAGVTVVAAAAAASAATTAKTSTTTVKKSSAKPGAKTTTTATTTTTKVTKETKATNGKATTTTKKSEVTTAAKTTPRKPTTESRPTSAAISEKKTPAKTSPTKPAASAAPAKGPLPSYAQPVAPRKPKEPKPAATPPSTDEKKKPLSTTTTARASSATHRSPRPQSATAATSSSTSTTASSTAATKTTKTTVTTPTASSRTALLSRPKSSPTKLTNGDCKAAPATSTDTKSPTKKYGVDSKNEGYKPGGGSAKTTTEKKEVKTKVETVSKSSTVGATPTRSPTKTTTPRPTSTPKSGEVKSKIGSMENATHTPGGGNVRIASKKPDFTNVTSKIGSKDKMDHKPGGGNIKIESKKIKVEAKSKIGSLNNATHKPGGGDKKIETKQLDWKVESKIGSLENAEHVAGGGDKKIEVQKTEWKAQSKIGSLDNVKHKPGGGDDSQTDSQKSTSKTETLDKTGPASGSEHVATEVQNGAASEN